MNLTSARKTDDPIRYVAELGESIAAHAANENWDDVEECAVRLRAAVMDVPARDRKEALLAARRSIEAVESLAREARGQVAGRLSKIRLGREMSAAYGASD